VYSIKQKQDHEGPVLDSVNGFDVIDCKSCRFKHIVPIPTPAELEELYRRNFYSSEKPLYLERHREDLDWWNHVYSGRYATLEVFLSAERRRLLDIGSGPGFFLLHGKQRGWQTLGIEPSAEAAAHARALGLEIREKFLSADTASGLGTFDVVHMREVLEHVADPATIVTLARDLLLPGGIICVAVPNDYNPFQQILRSVHGYAPWWVVPPHHINYFDFDSLTGLLERNGFQVVDREATFPIDIFLLMGDNYVGNDPLGRACHSKRKSFEMSVVRAGQDKLLKDLYRSLGCLGLGREAVLYGRRL